MRIILHIFWKDVKHHWPAAAVSVALISFYAWDQPRRWAAREIPFRFLAGIIEILPVFIMLAWLFMIARVVQEESLIGDRQFWLTRPYKWPKLLASKFLFAFAFANLPLFIAQLILLKLASFPVLSSIPGLLFIHLMLLFIAIVPFFAVSTLSSGIGRTTLMLIGFVLYVIGIGALLNWIPGASFSPEPFNSFQPVSFLAGAFVVVLIQYIWRKTWISWIVFSFSLLVVYAMICIPAFPGFADHFYPAPTANTPFPASVSFDTAVSFERNSLDSFEPYGNEVNVQFPIRLDNFDDKSLLILRGAKIDLDLPDGKHWTSHWQNVYREITSSRTRVWPYVQINRTIFNKYREDMVNARLSLAFEVYGLGSSIHSALHGNSISLPDGARCNLDLTGRLKCFSALAALGPYLIQANLPSANCPSSAEKSDETWADSPAFNAFFNDSSLPDFDLTPVHEASVGLTRYRWNERDDARANICANSPLLLTSLRRKYNSRGDVVMRGIKLSNYVPGLTIKIDPRSPHPHEHNPSDTLSFNFSHSQLGETRRFSAP